MHQNISRVIGILSKLRHFLTIDNLRNIYFGIFSSILTYSAQIWGQHHNNHVKRIIKLQDKAIRSINFAEYREQTSNLYKKYQILKFTDNIALNNFMYVRDSLKGCLPSVLTNNFDYLHEIHNHDTRTSAL